MEQVSPGDVCVIKDGTYLWVSDKRDDPMKLGVLRSGTITVVICSPTQAGFCLVYSRLGVGYVYRDFVKKLDQVNNS